MNTARPFCFCEEKEKQQNSHEMGKRVNLLNSCLSAHKRTYDASTKIVFSFFL